MQLKELGKNPPMLGDTVDPTLEVSFLYLQRIMVENPTLFGGTPQTAALGNAAHGFQAFNIGGVQASVPINETWYIYAVAVSVVTNTIAAADTVRANPGWSPPGSGAIYPFTPATADNVTARARTWAPEPMPAPGIWVPPGTNFWLVVYDLAVGAGTYTFNLEMRASRVVI